jgi:hypothetical protein
MSIESTSILPERTTRLAYVFIHTLFDWWVMRVDKELFLLLWVKDMTLTTPLLIDRHPIAFLLSYSIHKHTHTHTHIYKHTIKIKQKQKFKKK